jgi:hypothetical protein
MYILSRHREMSKQINIHEIDENFRRNFASNPFFFFIKNKSSCIKRKKDNQSKHVV